MGEIMSVGFHNIHIREDPKGGWVPRKGESCAKLLSGIVGCLAEWLGSQRGSISTCWGSAERSPVWVVNCWYGPIVQTEEDELR